MIWHSYHFDLYTENSIVLQSCFVIFNYGFVPVFLLAAVAPSILCNPIALGQDAQFNSTGTDNTSVIVTWDSRSLLVNGERTLIYSGEFHPFRLPSPALWLDVFQKIKAMSYTAVSFYLDWALLEGEEGAFRADGIFDYTYFLDAAQVAGLYLIARPGPYINAEVSGGGFPGWLQRTPATLRSNESGYLDPALRFLDLVTPVLAEYQITNGGPIVMLQVENEYSLSNISLDVLATEGLTPEVIAELNADLESSYMQDIEDGYRAAGINIPLSFNDPLTLGRWATGSGIGAVDIYGTDAYPFGYGSECSDPSTWSLTYFPTEQAEVNYTLHLELTPTTPNAIFEFQGGNPQGWGGSNQGSDCGALFGPEFEDVFYKYIFSQSVIIFNIYMTFGGTNWGNLGYPGGYTSYDQGSVIGEDRAVSREKYSYAKLLASSLKVSPAYLSTIPRTATAGIPASNVAITVTILDSQDTPTKFYHVRQTDVTSLASTSYTLAIETSAGNFTVPQIGNADLTLNGRDSKIHLIDYAVGSTTLVYSTAEIFSWSNISGNPIAVLYGSEGEVHELAVQSTVAFYTRNMTIQQIDGLTILQWNVKSIQQVVTFANGLQLYLVWRNDVYNYWALDIPTAAQPTHNLQLIVKAGYLVRNASIINDTLYIVSDVNTTTTVEVIAGPSCIQKLFWNGEQLTLTAKGTLSGVVTFDAPNLALPDLEKLSWMTVDSLPELQADYDDSLWVSCTNTVSNNTNRNLTTPTSLYSGDYGFHSGSLIYRGHFIAEGATNFSVTTQGGTAFGHSIWLDNEFLGSWIGDTFSPSNTATFNIGNLTAGTEHIFTLLIDIMGYEENFLVGSDDMKTPRGILDWSLGGQKVDWKMTGNLGGEQYKDKTRGPLNEGSMFAERQGFHLPGAPMGTFMNGSPLAGLSAPGIGFYSAYFNLDIPTGFDVPLSINFANSTSTTGLPAAYRVQLFVNGYQFGKYVNNIGPQSSFPVPEGILNHQGTNYLCLTVWALDAGGASLAGISIEPTAVVQSGYGAVIPAPQPHWTARTGAY